MAGALVRASDYVNATRLRRKMADAFHALFSEVDVIATASSLDPPCRIDDPKAGWKGRGLWAANGDRTPWLIEGGKGTKPLAAHFQLRPDPLAK